MTGFKIELVPLEEGQLGRLPLDSQDPCVHRPRILVNLGPDVGVPVAVMSVH